MSRYDTYEPPVRETRYYREERHRAEPRYEQQEYLSVNPASRTQLIPRVSREDSDLSIEEVRRDFPPPGYAARDVRRARSAEPGYDDDYYYRRDHHDSRSVRDDPRDHRSRKAGSVYYEEEERRRKRVLNKQEQIIAAVVGGVIAAGAKEVWDRREAKEKGLQDVNRNLAASAALAAGGAFAGYQGAEVYNKHAAKEEKKSTYVVHKGRDGRIDERYYSDEEEDPKERKGNKSFLESALGAAGLGGAIKALTGGGGDDHRSEGRSRRGSPDSTRSRGGDNANRMQKAAKASLVAGAAEAFRVSKEPGGWKGEKMKRILTAAAGAATIDAAHNPDKDSKRHLMESVIGGLVGNRVLNGSRKDIEEDRRTGRSRSRSRARSEGGGGGTGIAALATAGLGALAGKKLLDKREESRSRSRRGSPDSYYSRDESPRRRQRSRSRSVVDTARRSLAKIGLGNAPADERSDYEGSRSSRRHRGYSPDDRYDDDYDGRGAYMRGGRGDEHDDRSARGGGRRRSRSVGRGSRRSSSVSSSDLGDSDEDEKRAKKMRGKQLITTGLATVATIHAAHNVYSSMEKRNARHKAVKEGRLDPTEARKLKSKALLQDAASIGIAALGIKGAISEMKEAKEIMHECHQFKAEKEKRHQRRLERLKRANNGDNYGRSRADNWSSSAPPRESRYYDDGPRYSDGNPYSATLPAPPVGYDRR